LNIPIRPEGLGQLTMIARILAEGYLRLENSGNSPAIPLAIPAPQSDESEPGLNSSSCLEKRGSDV